MLDSCCRIRLLAASALLMTLWVARVQALSFGQTVTGSISAAGEEDRYTFTADSGDTIIIRMSESSSGLEPEVRLYGPDGKLVKSMSDYTTAEISYVVSRGGQYTIVASDSGGTDTGGYGLFLQRLNSPGNATGVMFGRTVTGSINTDAAMDSYTFSANAGDTVLIRMSESSSGLEPEVRLYGPDGKLVKSMSEYTTAEFSWVLPTSGQYTILAGDSGGTDTGGYGLFLQRLNNPGNATGVTFGRTVTGSISADAEMDSYTFSANAGDTVLIRMSESSSGLEPEVRLYGPDGKLVKSMSEYTTAEISWVLPTSGRYTILAGDSGGTDTGGYGLFLQRLNNPGNATGVTFGRTVTGSISADAEMDSYTFSANAGDTVLIRMSESSSSLEPEVRLYGPDGKLVKSTSDYTTAEISYVLSRGGQYTILAGDSGGTDTGGYSLIVTIDRVPPPAPWTATVQADIEEAPAGTPVLLTGRAARTGTNAAVSNVQVTVHLQTKGTERTLSVRTDTSGNFQMQWQPLPREAGRYSVWAEDEDAKAEAPEDEFVLFGADVEPSLVTHKIITGESLQAHAMVHNLGDNELSGLSAQVENRPDKVDIDWNLVDVLGSEGNGVLEYTITVSDVLTINPEFDVVISYLGQEIARLHVRVEVVPPVPVLTVSPSPVTAEMMQGGQTVVNFELTNAGGAPTGDLDVVLPDAAWMSLTTPAYISSLDPNESVTLSLALRPSDDLALGLYSGHLLVDGPDLQTEVPFEFNCISEVTGGLSVTAVDELTYYAEGEPKVIGAQVTITDPYTGLVVASDVTGSSGTVTFPGLAEAYYDIEVTAENHGTFQTTLFVSRGIETPLTAFLPGQYLTYKWTVIPGDFNDTYDFTVTAVFETDVPVPVVTVEPLMLDLCDLTEEVTQIEYTITNHGLIAAKDAAVAFNDFGGFEFTPLVDELGDIPAKTSITIPVLIRNTNLSSAGGPCNDCNQCAIGEHVVTYHLQCGDDDLLYRVPFYTKACVGACYREYPGGTSSGGGGGGVGYQGGFGGGGSGTGAGVDTPVVVSPDNPPPQMLLPCPSCDVRVTIQIDQRLVFTRQGFRAMLELTNNGPTYALEGLKVVIAIDDEQGNPSDHLFGIYPPELTGLDDVDGNSSLLAGRSAAAQWLIVALPEAACEEPKRYSVRGELSYVIAGQAVTVPLYPVPITVLPSPELEVNYFLERDVYSDDPFTEAIEPATPFSLGLIMTNHGCGVARDVTMTSSQPKIIDNEKGLLIDFQIIGTRVGADDITPALNVSLGDIEPDECKVAQWMMESSLQGHFVEYDANYVHVDGLGDKRLSLIEAVSIHEMVHVVRGTCPADDGISDFLTNDEPDQLGLPDTVHLSGVCSVEAVEAFVYGSDQTTRLSENLEVIVTVPDVPNGYFYARWPEPTGYNLPILSVTRSDGVAIPVGENVWITRRTIREQGVPPYQENLLHLFDCGGSGTYTIIFGGCEDAMILDITSTAGGTVIDPGIGVFPYCEPEVVDVQAAVTDPNYHFTGWTGTAVTKGKVTDPANLSTTVVVDDDYTLRANFGLIPRQLTVSSTEGGSVVVPGEGVFEYDYGTSAPVEAVPDSCYEFIGWTGTAVDSDKVIDPVDPNTAVLMDGDYTLQANFAIIQYTLTVSSTDGGSVVVPGEGTFEYECGTMAPLEARAEGCYQFAGWKGTAVDAGKVADPNAPNTTVTIDESYTLQATFKPIRYTLTVTSTRGGIVSKPGEDAFECDCGISVPIEAVADEYADFVGWSGTAVDNGKVADPTIAATTVTVDGDYTLQANFKIRQHTVTISSTSGGFAYLTANQGETSRSWSSGQTVQLEHGTKITLGASADPGYAFTNWSGTIYSPTDFVEFVLDQDYNLCANFMATPEP